MHLIVQSTDVKSTVQLQSKFRDYPMYSYPFNLSTFGHYLVSHLSGVALLVHPTSRQRFFIYITTQLQEQDSPIPQQSQLSWQLEVGFEMVILNVSISWTFVELKLKSEEVGGDLR